MSFWFVTAKRGAGFGGVYLIMGIVLAIFGVIISNLVGLIPANLVPPTQFDLRGLFPYLSVALLSLSALMSATPIPTLFIYDKNNGLFEYLLSTGLDQLDIFKAYLKASLFLAGCLLVFGIAIDVAIGAYLGTALLSLAVIAALTFAMGISVVALVTVAMMAFGSLQKRPTGANQPLGIIVGIVPIMPSLFLPLLLPSMAAILDLAIASATILISVALLISAGRILLRERLLP
jgi:hypothetical protein